MPSSGAPDPAISRATRSIVPSPPKTMSRSTARVRAAASAQVSTSKPANLAVAASARVLRFREWIKAAAWRTRPRAAALSALAISPMRRICSASLFNQNQEFLVAGRTQQRRIDEALPLQLWLRSDKLFQLAHDPLMDRRVGNHARAFVGFGLAGFKLRLDQRHDSTERAEQCNGGWKNFAQRNERAIDGHQVHR